MPKPLPANFYIGSRPEQGESEQAFFQRVRANSRAGVSAMTGGVSHGVEDFQNFFEQYGSDDAILRQLMAQAPPTGTSATSGGNMQTAQLLTYGAPGTGGNAFLTNYPGGPAPSAPPLAPTAPPVAPSAPPAGVSAAGAPPTPTTITQHPSAPAGWGIDPATGQFARISAPTAPSVAPTTSPPAPGVPATATPPAGATLILNEAGLAGLTASQIWREPGSNRIFRLPTAGAPAAPPTSPGGAAPSPAPAMAEGSYMTIPGDTMSKIAARNGLTLAELGRLNPQIIDLNRIGVGQQITTRGPGSGAAGAPAGTPAPSPTGGTTAGATGSAPAAPGGPFGGTGGGTATDPYLAALNKRLEGLGDISKLRSDYIKSLEARPSSLDALKKLETDAGLPELRARYLELLKGSGVLEEKIDALPEQIRNNVKDFVVNASQLSRMTAAEAAPLATLFNAMRRTLTELNTTIGISEKQVDRYLDASKEDQSMILEAMKARIDAGQDEISATRDVYEDYLDFIQKQQENDNKLNITEVKEPDGTIKKVAINERTGARVWEVVVGQEQPVGAGTGGTTAGVSNDLNDAANDLRATTGSDGFVNTAAYQEYRNKFIQAHPGKAKDFDSHMRNLGININPNDPTAASLLGLIGNTLKLGGGAAPDFGDL